MKNKNLLIGGIVVLILLVAGGFFVLSSKKSAKEPVATESIGKKPVEILSSEEIGLTLKLSSDKRKVIMEVTKTQGISELEYELLYTAQGDLQKGVIGNLDIKSPGATVRQEIVLGTCSDVCHYDKDVSNIKVILKVVKDGKTVQVEETLEP